MLMLSGYFDESGDEQDQHVKIVGIAGCVAPVAHWERFSIDWRNTLDDEGIQHFHMREFAHSSGQFKTGWKGNEERRSRFYGKLWRILESITPMYYGCFIPMESYRQLFTAEQRKRLGDAYFIAYQGCMSAVMSVMLGGIPVTEIATVFDDRKGVGGYHDAFYERVVKGRFWRDRIPRPIRRDMRKILPLQAADIVAYECSKEYERRLHKSQYAPRPGFQRIEESIKSHFGQIPGEPGSPIIFRPAEFIDSIAEMFRNEQDEEQSN